jgi:hypothetical protein
MSSGDGPGLQNRRAARLADRRCVRLAHASANFIADGPLDSEEAGVSDPNTRFDL